MIRLGYPKRMEDRRIGSLSVSAVGLGCNNFGWGLDAATTSGVVESALEAGMTFFDTADVYGQTNSERFLGQALQGRRQNVVVATKFGADLGDGRKGAKPDYVRQAVEDSLRRLGTDYIDLYQLHMPDSEVPIDETLGVLHDLVQAGKVREVGCSNFSAAQLRTARDAVPEDHARFASVQNDYSLLHRDAELEVLPECERLGTGFIPYFPLANGLLTGKYRKGQPAPEGSRLSTAGDFFDGWLNDANLDRVESLSRFAEARDHTILELAISWLLVRPAVASVITGATSPDQVRANVHAGHWQLTESELSEIDRVLASGS